MDAVLGVVLPRNLPLNGGDSLVVVNNNQYWGCHILAVFPAIRFRRLLVVLVLFNFNPLKATTPQNGVKPYEVFSLVKWV